MAKIIADDGRKDDFWGKSVSISGDTAVIGAYKDDGSIDAPKIFR
jgi:hypothetical protein